MAKQRDPARDKAKKLYLDSRGKMKTGQIAAAVGKSANTISKWKRADAWDAENAKRKRGGQPGNKNAVGGGAPGGNQNALRHGAYARARLATFSNEQRAELDALATMDAKGLLMLQIREKYAKKIDLVNRIAALGEDEKKKYFRREKKVFQTPKDGGTMFLNMRVEEHDSTFERRRILEEELERIDGQIDRCIQSLYSMLNEAQRVENESVKTLLMKYRAAGIVPEDLIEELVGGRETEENSEK